VKSGAGVGGVTPNQVEPLERVLAGVLRPTGLALAPGHGQKTREKDHRAQGAEAPPRREFESPPISLVVVRRPMAPGLDLLSGHRQLASA
jgi:hypothetical protein